MSRVLGVVRMAVFTRVFGAGAIADAYWMGFLIPNLSRRLFGEGALSAAFIPIYTQTLQKDPQQAEKLSRAIIGLLVAVLVALAAIGALVIVLIRPVLYAIGWSELAIHMSLIMLPYMVMICPVALLGGIQQVHGRFWATAAAPVIMNIVLITATLLVAVTFADDLIAGVYVVALALLVAGFGQVILQLIPLRQLGLRVGPLWSPAMDGIKRVVRLMAPMMIGLGAYQVAVLCSSLVAYSLGRGDVEPVYFEFFGQQIAYPMRNGAVLVFQNANLLYQFPLGVFSLAIATAIFPLMSRHAAAGDMAALRTTVNQGVSLTWFVTIPATVGLMVLAVPVSALLYEGGRFTAEDTERVAWCLQCFMVALVPYSTVLVLARAFYSLEDSRTPLRIAIPVVVLNLVLVAVLVWPIREGGIGLGTSIASIVQCVWLWRKLGARLAPQPNRLMESVAKILVCTAVMGVLLIAVRSLAAPVLDQVLPGKVFGQFDLARLVEVTIEVIVGAGSYALMAHILKIHELSTFVKLWRDRRGS